MALQFDMPVGRHFAPVPLSGTVCRDAPVQADPRCDEERRDPYDGEGCSVNRTIQIKGRIDHSAVCKQTQQVREHRDHRRIRPASPEWRASFGHARSPPTWRAHAPHRSSPRLPARQCRRSGCGTARNHSRIGTFDGRLVKGGRKQGLPRETDSCIRQALLTCGTHVRSVCKQTPADVPRPVRNPAAGAVCAGVPAARFASEWLAV